MAVIHCNPKRAACNIGAGEYEERTSTFKRPLFLRKVKLKNEKGMAFYTRSYADST